jgi:HK97 family phage prohead protease
MTHAAFEITEFKAVEDGDQPSGLFAARVSTYGNVDRNGDRMVKGAFDNTIGAWKSSGSHIPVVFSHEHKDPEAFIGSVDPANITDTDEGLIVAGKFDVESSPKARTVFNLLKKGLLKQWSFAYSVKKERVGADKARELLEVDLFEVGPTLVGANANALTLAVKEMGTDEVIRDELGIVDAIVAAAREPETDTKLDTLVSAALAPPDLKMDPAVAKALAEFDTQMDKLIDQKVGRALSAKTEAKVRAALAAITDILVEIGTEQEEEPAEAKAAEPEPADDLAAQARKQLEDARTFLALHAPVITEV